VEREKKVTADRRKGWGEEKERKILNIRQKKKSRHVSIGFRGGIREPEVV